MAKWVVDSICQITVVGGGIQSYITEVPSDTLNIRMNKGCTDNVKLDCSSGSKHHAAWQRPRINPQHWNDKNKDHVSCHNQIDSLYICTQTEPAGQKPQGTATLKMWCWTKHRAPLEIAQKRPEDKWRERKRLHCLQKLAPSSPLVSSRVTPNSIQQPRIWRYLGEAALATEMLPLEPFTRLWVI